MHGEQRLHGRQIVVRRDQHLAFQHLRDARGVRHGRGKRFRRLRRLRHERVVVAAVVPALELHDLVAVAEGARRAQREERRLAPRRGEPHLVRARHRAADLVGKPDRRFVDEKIRRAVLELLGDGPDDRRMRMSEEHRPRAEQVVDVLASAPVPQASALRPLHHEGQLVAVAAGAEHAAGQAFAGEVEERGFVGGSGRAVWRHRIPRWIENGSGAGLILRRQRVVASLTA